MISPIKKDCRWNEWLKYKSNRDQFIEEEERENEEREEEKHLQDIEDSTLPEYEPVG